MPDVHDRTPATRADQAPSPAQPISPSVLSKMGHELRSPLNGILGLTQIMLMKLAAGPVEPAQQVRHLDMVQASAKRLQAVIDHLVDIAKIESGALHPRAETFDCRTVVADTVRLFASAAEASRVELLQDSPDAPVLVTSDPRIVGRVLHELLDNAVKFAQAAPRVVRVRVDAATGDGSVLISVEDNGPGIPEPEQDRIFDAFVRGKAAAERDDNGSGLGLHLALLLAGLIGARLTVHSEHGSGTSFTLHLPASSESQGA